MDGDSVVAHVTPRAAEKGKSPYAHGRTREKGKRALIVNYCGRYLPSGVVRALQFEPLFRTSPRWDATFTSRHSETLMRLSGDRRLAVRIARRPFRKLLARYMGQWDERQEEKIIEQAKDFDLVSVIKSRGIRFYQRLLKLNGPRVVMDINDAVWAPVYAWPDLPETLAMVHGVICENECIARYARQYNSSVFVVPDSPQIEAFDLFRDKIRRNPEQIVLGWIGLPDNIDPLLGILEPLEDLFARYPQLRLRVVGAGPGKLPKMKHIRYSCRPTFDQARMVQEVLHFDIGLFPLRHNDDGLARGTLKAKVYMSGQAAVVADDFGENPNLIQDGVNGFLAASPDDWHRKIERLITDAETREAVARRGLETVRTNFTAACMFEKLIASFDSVVKIKTP